MRRRGSKGIWRVYQILRGASDLLRTVFGRHSGWVGFFLKKRRATLRINTNMIPVLSRITPRKPLKLRVVVLRRCIYAAVKEPPYEPPALNEDLNEGIQLLKLHRWVHVALDSLWLFLDF